MFVRTTCPVGRFMEPFTEALQPGLEKGCGDLRSIPRVVKDASLLLIWTERETRSLVLHTILLHLPDRSVMGMQRAAGLAVSLLLAGTNFAMREVDKIALLHCSGFSPGHSAVGQ